MTLSQQKTLTSKKTEVTNYDWFKRFIFTNVGTWLSNGLFQKPYFQGLVQQGLLDAAGYKKVTGEDYVAPQAQPAPQA